MVLESEPYRRLSYRWHNYQPEHAAIFGWSEETLAQLVKEPLSKVTFDIEPMGGTVKLTVVHDDFVPDSEMLKGVSGGWPTILSNLKTLLETDETLPLPSEMTIVIRSTSDEAQTAAMLREAVASLSHEVPVSEVKTMGAVVSDSVSTPRSTTILFAAFAGLALTLGIIGIYGVLSFLVSNRTQEIGIRMALGAQRRDVLRSVMGAGAKLSLAGWLVRLRCPEPSAFIT